MREGVLLDCEDYALRKFGFVLVVRIRFFI